MANLRHSLKLDSYISTVSKQLTFKWHCVFLQMKTYVLWTCDNTTKIDTMLTLNIPSLARQRCLQSWGPRRTPWFFCNFSTVWCGSLLKFCFLGFWNYNSVIQALLASNILCLFISTEVTDGHGTSPHSLIIHPASEHCHLLSIVGGLFFSNLQRSEPKNNKNNNIPHL